MEQFCSSISVCHLLVLSKKVTLLLFIGGDYDLAIQGTILIYNSGKCILADVTKNTLRHLYIA